MNSNKPSLGIPPLLRNLCKFWFVGNLKERFLLHASNFFFLPHNKQDKEGFVVQFPNFESLLCYLSTVQSWTT